METKNTIKIFTSKVGENRNEKRIWLESKRLENSCFRAGTEITVKAAANKIVIKAGAVNNFLGSKLGISKIHSRRGKPLLDLNNKEISKSMKNIDMVTICVDGDTITIEPSIKDISKGGYRKAQDMSMVDFFSGGGLISEAMRQAKFNPIMAIERDPQAILNYEANFPNTTVYETDILDLDFTRLPKKPTLAVAGVPCTHHSNCRPDLKKKRKKEMGLSEGNEALLIVHALVTAFDFMQPQTILIEEVESFENSVSELYLTQLLGAMGWKVIDKKILKGADFNSMQNRNRYCLVMSKNPNFQLKIKTNAKLQMNVLEDILEVPSSKRKWLNEDNSKTIAYFKRAQEKNKKIGRGFKMQAYLPSDTSVNTISGGYAKRRITDSVLHNNNNEFSFFTDRELARLFGLPDNFRLVGSYTTNCRLIGQGVLVDIFSEVGNQIMTALKVS